MNTRLRSTIPASKRLSGHHSHRLRGSRHQRLTVGAALLPVAQLDIKPDWGQRLSALGSLAAVAVAVAALLYTNQANREQQNLTEQGQITDRFSTAVEQLGSSNMGTRIGGIYALQRIMRDSPSDQAAIIDVLSAFVRVNSAPVATRTSAATLGVKPPSPHDVQAAVAVLARRPNPSDQIVNLTGADLSIPKVNLSGADLHGTDLSGVDLRESLMSGTNLTEAVLNNANLTRASLVGARLDNTSLVGARLDNATLTRVSGGQAIFRGANLAHANFHSGNLRSADLHGADLSDADLRDADLTGAILTSANLTGADLRGADLNRANLTSAKLTAVKFDASTKGSQSLKSPGAAPAGIPLPSRTAPRNPYNSKQQALVLNEIPTSIGGRWQKHYPSGGACAFSGDGLHVIAESYYHNCDSALMVRDFTYEATFRFGTSRAGGIIFRQNGIGAFYAAKIGRSGTLLISKYTAGQEIDLFEGRVSSPDVGKEHRLTVTATGADITLYFDGLKIGSTRDSTFREGTIGVFTDGGVAPDGADPRGEAIFERVRVWKGLSGGSG